jgi:glycosyltransferase involved in cell wall biosynthesis
MKKICIVSGFPLSTNPRAYREALALAQAGFEVEIITSILNIESLEIDLKLASAGGFKVVYVLDIRNRTQWFFQRLRKKLLSASTRLRLLSNSMFGYSVPEIKSACVSSNADLYMLHLESAMSIGSWLVNRGKQVSVDFEDWFSEDLPLSSRTDRPVHKLKEFERYLLHNSKFAYTTSYSLASALASAYDCETPFVVYNTFPISQLTIREKPKRRSVSLCWFSQTVGQNRGLEILFDALPKISHDVELNIRGNMEREYGVKLVCRLPEALRANVRFHALTNPDELVRWVSVHDLGFAGETGYCPNNDLTISNKILTYLNAGVPVVASDTNGHREVHENLPNYVFVYDKNSPNSLAAKIECAIGRLSSFSSHQVQADASKHYSWKNCFDRILERISQLPSNNLLVRQR